MARTALHTIGRLARRAAESWPIWVSLAILIGAGAAVRRIQRPPPYSTTVVLRLVEGILSDSNLPVTSGQIRSPIDDLAFSRANLLRVAQRHPRGFPDVEQDPASVVDEMREALEVTILENDFVEYRSPTDPRRAVRIEITFKAADPDLSWEVAQDLADLLSAVELTRQERKIERRVASTDQAETRNAEVMEESAHKKREAAEDRDLFQARAQVVQRGVETRTALGAMKQRLALRFEVADPGQRPVAGGETMAFVAWLTALMCLLLAAAGLIAGAFDPRVLDRQDLLDVGVDVLGRVPDRV